MYEMNKIVSIVWKIVYIYTIATNLLTSSIEMVLKAKLKITKKLFLISILCVDIFFLKRDHHVELMMFVILHISHRIIISNAGDQYEVFARFFL